MWSDQTKQDRDTAYVLLVRLFYLSLRLIHQILQGVGVHLMVSRVKAYVREPVTYPGTSVVGVPTRPIGHLPLELQAWPLGTSKVSMTGTTMASNPNSRILCTKLADFERGSAAVAIMVQAVHVYEVASFEKNVRLLRSLPTEWYTKATAMEEGRNLENYTVQGLLDELRTYEHELKKKKEEQVTPFPTELMTTPRVPSSEGTCPRNCDTPSSSQPSSSKMENYDEEFAMMVKQFRKFKKFFKKADSVRRPSKGKPQVSDSPPESYLCYNCRKPGHWKSACPHPKVEKYGERERIEKKKKEMVAAESDESSSSSSDEKALICMERRVEKSNHEDRWTISEDDILCLMAKDDADQEVTSQTSCSSSYESIPISENLFDQFKKMMKDFEEINLKHSSLTEENKLFSEENLKLTEGRKRQLNEITQLKTENESLSEKVKSLNKELGILKSKEAVDKLLEATKHKGREGLGFDPSNSKRKGKTTFIPPKPTAKPNKQKGKEKEKPIEVPKKVVPPKNCRKLDRPQKGNNFRRKPSDPHYTRGYTHYGVDRSFPRNSEWRTMPRYSHPSPQKLFVPPKYAYNRHRTHYAQPRQNYRSYQPSNDFGLTKGLGNLVYKGLTIQAVSYVEGLNYNLLSISQFCDKGYSLEFCKDMASLKNISTNEVILTGKRIRNIYEVIWSDVKEACLISKGENRAGTSATAEESSSDNIPLIHMTKTTKRKKVVSPSIEAPQNLAPINLEEEEESSDQGELQRKKKRKINSPSTSGNINPDELKEKEPEQLLNWDQQLKNEKIIKKCLGIPVNHNCEQILDDYWVWQRNPEDLHLEYLANTPVLDCEADDEDTAVFKPVFSKATKDQVALTSEATAEDFQTFPETSPALETETSPAFQETSHASEMVLTEVVQEKATPPSQEQNQEIVDEEEFQPLIQSQVLEILTTPCEISNSTETEIPEKSAEIPEQSALPETMEQAVEAQKNSEEAAKEAQMAELEVSETQVAIFEKENTAEERDSLSRDISNFVLETEGESERTLKVTDEEDVQEDAESLPMQLFQRIPSSHQVTNFHFHSSSTPALPDEIPEIWTKKVQGLIESALASQHASFRQEIEQMEVRHTQLIEKSEGKHNADLKEISKSVQKTLEIISLLSETVSNTMEMYASDSQLHLKEINKVKEQIASVTISLQKQMSLLQMDIRSALAVASANQVVTKDYLKVIIDNQKEAFKLFRLIGANSGNRKMEVILQQHSPSPIPQLPIAIKEGEVSYIPSHLNLTNLILEAQQRNPENSAQLLSSSGLDGTEVIGTFVDHFSNDAQSEERRENLRRIKELCGNMKGISEVAGSSKRKRN
ncbi:unnamed protein product [Cuscuta campestris]|uniref:CCHC-type domain-containing protein n=1 Tax=Cuscuta campestris TaxID=132261 RepID=A0A484KUJ9_9ASTE|nr:unnamed protein product [Cuscuta campestris]